jgi:hypothetical protein
MEFGGYIAVDTVLLFLSFAAFVFGSFALRTSIGRCFWALGLLGLLAWAPLYYWMWGPSDSPQRSVRAFLLAAKKGDCQAVWSSFSPYGIKTAHGTLVSLPYSVELNEIPMMVLQHHKAEEFFCRAKD